MQPVLAVAAGGALGSVLRFYTVLWARRFGADFPWGTLAVNVIGSFVIGIVWAWCLARPGTPDWVRLGLMTGVLGGFTTLSSVSLETVLLAESGARWLACANALGNLAGGILACVLGLAVARPLFAP